MSVSTFAPYLQFNGQCAEAFAAYAEILEGHIQEQHRYRGSPMEAQVSADRLDQIMHSDLRFDGHVLMGADTGCEPGEAAHRGYSLMLSFNTVQRARAVFDQLEAGGQVIMPFAETFWSPGFGMVCDRFGIRWAIGTNAA